jgi:hypothetical protein
LEGEGEGGGGRGRGRWGGERGREGREGGRGEGVEGGMEGGEGGEEREGGRDGAHFHVLAILNSIYKVLSTLYKGFGLPPCRKASFLVHQVSQQREDADRDKSNVIGKLAVLQEEQRKLIDEVTDRDKRAKELIKVGVALIYEWVWL